MIKYSVIICSYNRFKLLDETIDSVLNVVKNRGDIEILLIDNNSNDGTAELKHRFKSHQIVKYFLETKQGLSHARNRGIKESVGEILVYLDDDIELVKNYFEICDETFLNSSISISGGKVLPHKIKIPIWLPEKYYFLVSVFDCGNSPKFVKHLMGGNFAIRKKDALRIGFYNNELGRNGTSLGGGEETEYQDRAAIMGYKMRYNPKQNILHKINNKLNEDYVLLYSKGIGKSLRIIDESVSKWVVLRKVIKWYIALFFCKILLRLTNNKKKEIHLKIINQYAIGYLNK